MSQKYGPIETDENFIEKPILKNTMRGGDEYGSFLYQIYVGAAAFIIEFQGSPLV